MIHAGAQRLDRQGLNDLPTPRSTPSWQPIPHGWFADMAISSLENSGIEITSEDHAISRDGLTYFGLLGVTLPGFDEVDYELVTGLRNSHDKSAAARLAWGSHVFVCDNMAFSGEVVVKRRHTKFIKRDLPGLLTGAVGNLKQLQARQEERYAKYKQTPIDDLHAHDLVVRMIDNGVVAPSQVPKVLDEWRKPTFKDSFPEKNAWRLMNAVTYILRDRSGLDTLTRRTFALQATVLDPFCKRN